MKGIWKSVIAVMMVTVMMGSSLSFAMTENALGGMQIATETEEPTIVSSQEVEVAASYSMFGNKLETTGQLHTYSDGSMVAELRYAGTSFLKMYLGTAEEAEAATEGFYEADDADGDGVYVYTIPVEKVNEAFDAAVLSSKGNWKDNTITITVEGETTPEPEPEPTIVSSQEVEVAASYSMFGNKLETTGQLHTYSDGSMVAELRYAGTSFLKMYLGTAEEAEAATEGFYEADDADGDGVYVYTIPVEKVNEAFDAAVLSSKGNWKDNTITITVEGETTPEPEPEPEPEPAPETEIPADGVYTIDVTSNASMFKVVACKLTVKDKVMTAVITLSGTGYDYLYMGTVEEAVAAGSSKWIGYKVDTAGQYTYEIPVEALDKDIEVAAHASKSDKWFDRLLTFESATLKEASEEGNNGGNTGGNVGGGNNGGGSTGNAGQNNGLTSEEDIKNMIANTQQGTVADGTYTPSFGYTGGTGRVTISCNKVVVKDGKATAIIVFSSPNYTYAKVNGVKYYNTNVGGNSTFEIPVNLNGTTTIAAETTAMGNPYEVEYVLYVYVDGTNVSNIQSEVTYDDNEDEAEVEETEEVEEENSWGDFDSEQQDSVEDEGEAAEETAGEEGSTSSMTPIVVGVVAGVVIIAAAGVVIAYKKNMFKRDKE